MVDSAAQQQTLPPGMHDSDPHDSDPHGSGLHGSDLHEAAPVRLRAPRRKRWPAPLRWLTIAFSILAGLAILGLVGGLFLVARLDRGPILVEGLGQRIAEGLQQRFSNGHIFRLGATMIEKGERGPQLSIDGLSVTGPDGEIFMAAPKARVSLDLLSLAIGDVMPRRLDVIGLELKLTVLSDGALAVSAGKSPLIIRPGQSEAATNPSKTPTDPTQTPAAADPAAADPAASRPAADPADPNTQARAAREALRPAAEALKQLMGLATGKGSPLGGLGQFGVVAGKLVFEDQTTGRETVFDGLDIQLERTSSAARLVISVNGPNGRWQMSVAGDAAGDDAQRAARKLDVEFSNLTLDEISLFAGVRELPFDLDSPLRLKFQVGVGADGEFRMAEGSFGLGKGLFATKDPDQEPIPIDRVSGAFVWDDVTRRFSIRPTQIESAGTRFLIGGEVAPPQSNNGRWAVALASIGDAQVGPERPGDSSIAISKFEIRATVDPAQRRFELERIALSGPQVQFAGSGVMALDPDGGRQMTFRATVGRMPAYAVLRLWPSAVGAQARAWLGQNLKSGLASGTMELDYDEAAFRALAARVALPEASMRIQFEVQDGVLQFLQGVAPARGLSSKGLITGKTTRITFDQGHIDHGGKQIALTGGVFAVTNTAPDPSPATVNVNLAGQIDTLAGLVNEPGLKPFAALALDPATLKGRFDGRLTVDFRIGARNVNPDIRIKAQANATNVSIENILGKERLEAANFQFAIEGRDLNAKGVGRMFGTPATFSIEKAGRGDVVGSLQLTLDDQARQKLGWSTGSRVTGPIALKMSGPLGGKEGNLQGAVELDLTRATIADALPGLGKPAGRAAKATFNIVQKGEATTLQAFNYAAGATSIRGSIELDRKGAFQSAALTSLKLSPGDELSGQITSNGKDVQISLNGPAIDMRPLIQSMTSPQMTKGEEGAGDAAGRVDVDLTSRLATGYNRQALADFSLKLSRQAGRFQRFDLTARTGRSQLRGRLTPGTNKVEVIAADGGAVMSFLDLYKRMEGGLLTLTAQVSANRIDGVLNVQSFTLRDEPALRRLVAEGVPRSDAQGRVRIDPSLVAFDRLRLNFTKDAGRIQLHDGIISGQTIGTTLEGMVDFPRDQVNMKGTFVPAYGLNNMFAKIPLFGPLLAGGSNEGLVGVNFSVTGRASAPVLNVNPLSAITPGFLRKIFGAVADGASEATQPSEAPRVLPPREAAPRASTPRAASPLVLTPPAQR